MRDGADSGGGATGRAFPIVLAGPSGAGKTTVRDRLLSGPDGDRFTFSVSWTTRARRSGEIAGVDYGFASRSEFEAMIEAGEMLEYATVHGELYGTPRANLDRAREAGTHLLLDIDVQGARQIREAVPDVVTIFLVPPTGGRILERLKRRGSETPEELARRLASARDELEAAREFDYVVVNDDLEEAVERVRRIVSEERGAAPRRGELDGELFARIIAELDRV